MSCAPSVQRPTKNTARTSKKDRALVRRFQKIDVNEPSVEDAVKILRGLKPSYEEHHGIRYTSEAIRTAVELSNRYIGDRKLPDKAIDVLDEAGAATKLAAPSKRKENRRRSRKSRPLFAKIARIPPKDGEQGRQGNADDA